MGSLQRRLAGWLVGSVVALLLVYWVVGSQAPGTIAEEYVAARLGHDAETLLAGLRVDPSGVPAVDPGYVAPVYRRPFSGHYYVVWGTGGRERSRSLWDEDLQAPTPATRGVPVISRGTGPQGQPVLIWVAAFQVADQPVRVAVAEDLTSIEADTHRLRLAFTVGSVVVLVVMVAVQRAIVRWSLRPLDRVREDCRRLEAGEKERLGEDVPAEVRPLVEEVNRLLRVLSRRLHRSREALANLAHAIKTPLTLLGQVGDGLAAEGPCAAEIRQGVERIREVVDRELKRARLAGMQTGPHPFCPAKELPDLAAVLRRVHRRRGLDLQVVVAPEVTFRGDREDLLELFGNLLDNAAKWARGRVVLRVDPVPGLSFTVEDDGPGVPAEEIGQIAARGVRLDEAVPGHGIGLAVCRDIVEQYGGTLDFSPSEALGGLRVAVRLPA